MAVLDREQKSVVEADVEARLLVTAGPEGMAAGDIATRLADSFRTALNLADGIAIRLYSEDDFEQRPEFTDPEILRTNLAAVILQMISVGVVREPGDILDFPFVQKPDPRAVKDGVVLLRELGTLRSGAADAGDDAASSSARDGHRGRRSRSGRHRGRRSGPRGPLTRTGEVLAALPDHAILVNVGRGATVEALRPLDGDVRAPEALDGEPRVEQLLALRRQDTADDVDAGAAQALRATRRQGAGIGDGRMTDGEMADGQMADPDEFDDIETDEGFDDDDEDDDMNRNDETDGATRADLPKE